MIYRHNSHRPGIRKAWPVLAASIVSLALVVAGSGQVNAGNGLVSTQSQADTAAHLQLAAVSAQADPHVHHRHIMVQTGSAEDDPHAHHRHMMDQKGYKRSIHNYDCLLYTSDAADDL